MTRARSTIAVAVAAGLAAGVAASVGAGCEPAERAQARAAQAPTAPAPKQTAQPVRPPVVDSDSIRVPAGAFELGSWPGTSQRNPAAEADLVKVQLPAFEIDRLPYPNDLAQAPRTGVDRDEASALCAQHGKRLCTEAEWERACKGPAGAPFATGAALDLAVCARNPRACASAEGVLALGTSMREWTASSFASGLGNPPRTAVLRGAGTAADLPQHRCAARTFATPDTRADELGFRCCRGEASSFSYPTEPARELARPLTLDRGAARAVLAKLPALAKLAPSFEPFSDADVGAALRRGGQSRDSLRLWTFMPAAFAWSPSAGEELWVLSGRTSEGAVLAVLYPLPDGRVVHAASSVIAEADTTLAIGASAQYPNQLTWTTCYSCAGEGGTIRFTDDARVEISYR